VNLKTKTVLNTTALCEGEKGRVPSSLIISRDFCTKRYVYFNLVLFTLSTAP
jgi:hypothetical protein